jgi:alpha-mannosidase
MTHFSEKLYAQSISLILLCAFLTFGYDLTKEKIQYEVAGAHLDDQFGWTLWAVQAGNGTDITNGTYGRPNTIQDFIPGTFNTNFAYFAQYPEYKFSFEGAFRYWLVKTLPNNTIGPNQIAQWPNWTTVKNYVTAGKWCVAGSGWTGGDVNIPSAEGCLRNYLLGETFFEDEFGKTSVDVYLPDCFGFGFALPTIAAHCGLKGFSTQKFDNWGGWFSTPFPIGKWYGPDSSYIFAALKPGGYGGGMDINANGNGDWERTHTASFTNGPGGAGIWA